MALRFSQSPRVAGDWRVELSRAITTFEDLERVVPFGPGEREKIREICRLYPPFISPFLLSLMDTGDPSDPIKLQVVPSPWELEDPGMEDPLAEDAYSPFPRAVHRYENRLLLVTTNRCALHCRYCFRKRNWARPPFTFNRWDMLKDYLQTHPQVNDLLISGGDPFLLSNETLKRLLSLARWVGTLKVIRLGTRVPVALPFRIEEGLLRVLEAYAPLWVCLHVNHPKELTEEMYRAVRALVKAGCTVVSQTVLLKGVNDSHSVLAALFTDLLSMGIKPYYLFQCDPAPGTAHFRVDVEEGKRIMEALWGRVSGLAYPHYAMDLPGGGGKVLLA